MTRLRSEARALAIGLLLSCARTADAQPPNTAQVAEARREFNRGADLAKRAQWAEALAAFERSAKLRPHAVTTYNIGASQRALGSYTAARETLTRALEQSAAARPPELAESLVADCRGFLAEIDRLLVTAKLRIQPEGASLSVDGRPLGAPTAAGGPFVAGVRPPGPGEPVRAPEIRVLLNPGTHVFTLSRSGFADAVVTKTFAPGSSVDLTFELDRLPAMLRISSTERDSVVSVSGLDVGVAPIELTRPAGTYLVLVRKPGFEPYEANVTVNPGQDLDLRATLAPERHSIVSRWWFWTGIAALAAGVATTTYFVARGTDTRQVPADGGGLGWVVEAR